MDHSESLTSTDPADDNPTASPPDPYVPLSYAELRSEEAPRDWLWRGYLLPGAVTLLTSLWKSGKTTLLSVLLSRLKAGGELAGLPVRAGRAVVVSEESPELWWQRGRNLTLDGHVQWLCRPFRGKPTVEQWQNLLGQVGRMHDREPVDLLAIDPLANLAPLRTENDSVEMLRAVAPLQRLTGRGVSVLLCHHPRKGAVRAGQAARGSGALPACADVVVEMHAVGGRDAQDRRRRLRAYSRYPATPASWAIEWTADGTDYRALGPSGEADFEHGWAVVKAVLEKAEGPMTRRAILRAWPDSASAPGPMTLWRWLGRAVAEKNVVQEGRGTRKDPYLYALPGMALIWQARFVEDFMRRVAGDPDGAGPP
jgi:hypothetical protein